MKPILIVSRSTVYQNKSGGLETQLANLISFLKKSYKVTVLTTAFKKNQKQNVIKIYDEVSYIFLGKTLPGEYGYSFYESIFWQIPFKQNFSSVYSNFQSRAANYYKNNLQGKFETIISQSSSAQKFSIKKERLILINHGTTLNEIKNRWVGLNRGNPVKFIKDLVRYLALDLPLLTYEYFINNNILFSKASQIILISNRLKKDFLTQHKSSVKKVVVIPNWIDTNKFSPKEKNKKLTVVYFGRIDFEKGLKEFILVAKNLPSVAFHVFGDGPDKLEFLKIGKLNNLTYHGSVTNDTIADFLAKSHLFLFLTKRKEGMPMSILEAMSSGCIVITTLKDKAMVTLKGYIVLSGPDQAIRIIKELDNNRNDLEKLSNINRNFALSNFSPENIANKYIEVIQK